MAIAFDKLPTDRPGGGFKKMEEGRHYAQINKVDIVKSANTGEDYLRVGFVTKDKDLFSESFFVNEKSFNLWKLGRLLSACKLELAGTGELKDLVKLLPNKKVIVDVVINDRGYPELDFSGNKEGVYARDEVVMETVAEEVEETVSEPETNNQISSTDDDF